MHIDTSGCQCTRQHVGAVLGADGGLQWSQVNRSINTLDNALRNAGSASPEWSLFVRGWRSETEWSGPKLQRYAERLAQLAEGLGGAKSNRQIVAGGFGIPDNVRAVDDAISGVIMSVAPVLPYGNIIRQAHEARRGIMYGSDSPAGAKGPGGIASKVAQAQSLTRRARRGDPAARSALSTLRARAATDTEARKQLGIVAAARRDDSKRIDAVYRRTRVAGTEHADEAQDRKLIASMIQRAGCDCEKKGRR